MSALLLNADTILMCPHGGAVTHIPAGNTSYRIDGRLPMLLGDLFNIAGCPMIFGGAGPCIRLEWMTASTMLTVNGRPALTLTSIAHCLSVNGVPNGPAIITRTQTGQREPDTFTAIHD